MTKRQLSCRKWRSPSQSTPVWGSQCRGQRHYPSFSSGFASPSSCPSATGQMATSCRYLTTLVVYIWTGPRALRHYEAQPCCLLRFFQEYIRSSPSAAATLSHLAPSVRYLPTFRLLPRPVLTATRLSTLIAVPFPTVARRLPSQSWASA